MLRPVALLFVLFSLLENASQAEDFNGDAVALIPEFKEFFTEKAPRKILTVDESSVTYYMFNRTKMKQYVFLTPANFFQINTAKKIVFLIHGWTESRNKTWYEDLKNAFLEKFDLNVIEVDYSQPASNRYPVAVLLSKSIGKIIAKFILQIPNVSLQNVTLVGHSLGGQVAGYVGKEIFAETGQKIGKIIALDPAGPLFTIRSEKSRLNPEDANTVEVIHTDRILGFYRDIGHIDFYINPFRSVQPGCDNLDPVKAAFCSHHMSYKYFIESLKRGGFLGTFCSSRLKFAQGSCNGNVKLPMFFESANKTGTYYIKTEEIRDETEQVFY